MPFALWGQRHYRIRSLQLPEAGDGDLPMCFFPPSAKP